MDKERFSSACNLIAETGPERNAIGTLGEKTLHAVLKHYFEPDTSKHEIRIGPYSADIANDGGIIEIQTRNFNALNKKLPYFLEIGSVTVVYPIPHRKWLVWIDTETGEVTKKRKSPKVGTVYEAFFELYKIKKLLTHPNLRLCFVLIDMTEYRNLNGWSGDRKKGSSRYDRIPGELAQEVFVASAEDYIKLIPESLTGSFTARDFKSASGLSLHSAQIALNVLKYVGAVVPAGKQGNRLVYRIRD